MTNLLDAAAPGVGDSGMMSIEVAFIVVFVILMIALVVVIVKFIIKTKNNKEVIEEPVTTKKPSNTKKTKKTSKTKK